MQRHPPSHKTSAPVEPAAPHKLQAMSDDPTAELSEEESPTRGPRVLDAPNVAADIDPDAARDDDEESRRTNQETLERRDAALSHVRKLGDRVLRASAVKVDRFDDTLKAEIERMGELMSDALGIGLAATQLGVLRVLVYRAHPDDRITALVNPVIDEQRGDRAGGGGLPEHSRRARRGRALRAHTGACPGRIGRRAVDRRRGSRSAGDPARGGSSRRCADARSRLA